MNADVTFLNPEYEKHDHQLRLVNQVHSGIDKAKLLLTQLNNEHDDGFATRVSEATLDNFVERITTTMAGQITRKNMVFEDIPDNVIEAMDSIAGRENLNQFVKDCTEYAIRDGKTYVLVDMGIDGSEPQFYHVLRQQLTNWRKNAKDEFTLAVIMESYAKEDGRFGVEFQTQYRVIDETGNVEIWREVDGQGWQLAETYPTSYNFLPLYEMNVDDIPPLYDITKLNIKHMNFTSYTDRYLKEALDPILFGQNLGITDGGSEDNPTIILGVNQMMNTDNDNSNLSWVELSGTNYAVSKENLLKIENDIASRALKLQSDSQVKTATQVSEENSESTSRLSDIATDLENIMNKAINAYSLMRYSKELVGQVIANRDFNSTAIDSNALTALNTLQVSGNLSKETLLKAVNDSEYVTIDDIDEEIALIEEQMLSIEPDNVGME